jgi:hypothetical protein
MESFPIVFAVVNVVLVALIFAELRGAFDENSGRQPRIHWPE